MAETGWQQGRYVVGMDKTNYIQSIVVMSWRLALRIIPFESIGQESGIEF
jgi:hypothetical protein